MERGALALKAKENLGVITENSEKAYLNSRQSWAIWACAGAFYLYECILRVSPSVMTEGLMHDFSLTSTALGILVSCYSYSYVALQIPCGVMVDAIGTRRILTASAALCAIGTFMFASMDILIGAQIGRFLVGAGSACAFISCMKTCFFIPWTRGIINGNISAPF